MAKRCQYKDSDCKWCHTTWYSGDPCPAFYDCFYMSDGCDEIEHKRSTSASSYEALMHDHS